MGIDQRKGERFQEIGRVQCNELCVFPGIVSDISISGCKVRFPAILSVDSEEDYELSFTFTRIIKSFSIILIGRPIWFNLDSDSTEIGFKFLHSPGTRQLSELITQLAKDAIPDTEEF